MWRCEDEKRRCEDEIWWDVKMRRCENLRMWRCENVWQTPTIRRTLRSDALGKNCWQITFAALMQPLQYCKKAHSTKHTAAAPSNLDAAITMRSAKTELRSTKELRATASEIWSISCKTSLEKKILKMWKRSFRARLAWKSESARQSWRCENEAFVRDLPEKVKVEDVKTKLSCETCLKKWEWKMWKRSFRARLAWKSESARCESEAFVRDFPDKVKVEDVKMKLSCETCLKKWKWKMWKRSFRARLAWKSESGRCENEAFVRDLPEKVKVQDVKAKLSCETSLTKWKWKMWKRSFRARLAWKSESGRCENEAFVRDLPEKVKVQDVKTKLSCEPCLKKWKWKMWKRSFRARLPWQSESGRCENEAFVRDLPEKVKVEDVKTKLSCESFLKIWTWKMWKRSFRARLSSKSERGRCENEAFVRDLPEKVKVEDVKTKLSCETCLKKWKCKMWKRSFRARLPWQSESGRCENEAFVRVFPKNLNVEDVKTKLSCETFLKIWKWKMWKRSFRARLPYCYSVVVIVVMLWLWWYCHSGDVVIVVILS